MKLLVLMRKTFYASINALRDTGIAEAALEKLADADAFRSIGLDRRQAVWAVSNRHDRPFALFKGQPSEESREQKIILPAMSMSEHVVQDYAATSLSLKAHPVSFVREKLGQLHILPANELTKKADGAFVKVAGLVLVRQRPGTAAGICFITIEDETGVANLVVFQKLFEQYRKEIIQSRLLMVEGRLQVEGEVIHVIVKRCYNLTKLLGRLTASREDDWPLLTLSRSDEKAALDAQINKNGISVYASVERRIFPGGRNFK